MTLHDLYLYCTEKGYPAEAERCDHYLRLQGFVSPVGRSAPHELRPGWLKRSLDRAHRNIMERPEHLKPARYRSAA